MCVQLEGIFLVAQRKEPPRSVPFPFDWQRFWQHAPEDRARRKQEIIAHRNGRLVILEQLAPA
jgi:hypothetical protein